MSGPRIYHMAPASEIRAGMRGDSYTPARFSDDGFVHCAAGRETVIAVARDYYATMNEPVMLLEIDPDCLTAMWKFEAAAPIEGGGTQHLETAEEFPHVYGPLNLESIRGVGMLGSGDGSFRWPNRFVEIREFLRSQSG